jgi:hypothetical protein
MLKSLSAVLLILVSVATLATAQVDSEIYNKAKSNFKAGIYPIAKQYFQTLVNDKPNNPYSTYSAFYVALCNFHSGEERIAQEGLKNILLRNANWNNIDQVYYWLIKTSIETNNPKAAFEYYHNISNEETAESAALLIESLLASIVSLPTLDELYILYPQHNGLAQRFATLLSENSLDLRQRQLLDTINAKFSISQSLPEIKRDHYKIAVLLPFMYESLDNTSVVSRNKFVIDLYSGMELAVKDLKAEGISVSIHPYDTKRSKETTQSIIELEELKGYDLIVGPLYPEPFQLVSEFSKKHKINIFNPVSGNQQIIEDNPFSFLLKPTNETMAWVAAKYAIRNFNENKNLIIIHDEDERHEAMAKLYSEILIENGYTVSSITKVTKSNNRDVLESLTKTYEHKLNPSERDSISKLPRRFVKGKLGSNGIDTIYYYEDRFKLPLESIGHMFVASSNTVVAANAVGGAEVRGDKIPIIGLGEWLNFNVLTLEQLERLSVALVHPNYLKFDSEEYYKINNNLTTTYRQPTSINQFSGYDIIALAGQLLSENGVYFQSGLITGKIYQGKVFEAYRYGYAQDNQIVPIVKMKESVLQIVNNIYE